MFRRSPERSHSRRDPPPIRQKEIDERNVGMRLKSESPEEAAMEAEETENYNIEEIVGHCLKSSRKDKGFCGFVVKWIGYDSSDNTSIFLRGLSTFSPVMDYWKKYWAIVHERGTFGADRKVFAVTHAISILHQWQQNAVVFCNDDNNLMSLADPLSQKYGWSYMGRGFTDPLDEAHSTFQSRLSRYENAINRLGRYFRCYPWVDVVNEEDQELPVPIRNLLFSLETESTATMDFNSDDEAIYLNNRMIHCATMSALIPTAFHTEFQKTMNECQRVDLRLVREDFMWHLVVGEELIPVEDFIIPLAGIVRRCGVAKKCMEEEGEAVALSNFTRLSQQYCLDQRSYHGLDKYISHSCSPNCLISYQFIDSPNFYGFVPVVRAKRDIQPGEQLTLDRFPSRTHFEDPVATHISYIVDKNPVDHLQCFCKADECRGMLWVETLKKGCNYGKMTKFQRLKNHEKPFYGRRIAGIPASYMERVDETIRSLEQEAEFEDKEMKRETRTPENTPEKDIAHNHWGLS